MLGWILKKKGPAAVTSADAGPADGAAIDPTLNGPSAASNTDWQAQLHAARCHDSALLSLARSSAPLDVFNNIKG